LTWHELNCHPPVTPPVEKLLELFQGNEFLGNKQIRELLGLKGRKNFRNYYIDPAMGIGAIEYTIPDKPNSRMQKYFILPDSFFSFSNLHQK